MEKKYELTDEILEVGGRVLHRINALRNFGNIKQGEIGGWIENEDNLSHCGDCWVYGDAEVYGFVSKHPSVLNNLVNNLKTFIMKSFYKN